MDGPSVCSIVCGCRACVLINKCVCWPAACGCVCGLCIQLCYGVYGIGCVLTVCVIVCDSRCATVFDLCVACVLAMCEVVISCVDGCVCVACVWVIVCVSVWLFDDGECGHLVVCVCWCVGVGCVRMVVCMCACARVVCFVVGCVRLSTCVCVKFVCVLCCAFERERKVLLTERSPSRPVLSFPLAPLFHSCRVELTKQEGFHWGVREKETFLSD